MRRTSIKLSQVGVALGLLLAFGFLVACDGAPPHRGLLTTASRYAS
jgi:hypothetical protein